MLPTRRKALTGVSRTSCSMSLATGAASRRAFVTASDLMFGGVVIDTPGKLVLPSIMQHPTKKIVIVGGGTAGWLTAGVIAAKHKSRMPGGFSVTLVESPNTPIIGVGEGTWPTLRSTLAKMGVSETDFFRECDAAFKQGAKFARWTTGAPDDA